MTNPRTVVPLEPNQRWVGADGAERTVLAYWPRTDTAEAAVRVRTHSNPERVAMTSALSFRQWCVLHKAKVMPCPD